MKNLANTRILLVEDNPDFMMLLKIMLGTMGFIEIFTAHDFDSGLAAFHAESPDICLLDIELGKGKGGVELAESIRRSNLRVPIIFMTAHYTEQQYEQSRHTRPSSFMNKELSQLKLHQAIELALLQDETLANTSGSVEPAPLITQHHYFFKIGDIYKSIPLEEVSYFFADQRLTSAHVNGRNYPTTVQLKVLERELYPRFMRTHKSYLVNLKLITTINPGEATIEIAGETLPIGYAYRKAFMESLRLIR